ncbi:nitroreductase family protein [Paenibacillus sp. y28]|uniref:nitroreductase family protein n=1 Tax=Paenibacillus sp. y28 TaxID=3129110 RepID=UPI00301932D0
MELSQLIKERRSVHVFQDRPVSLDLVKELLDTSVWVPNHRMTQPWRFVILHGEGKARLEPVARSKNGRFAGDPEKQDQLVKKLMSIPLYLAVIMKEDPNPATREEDYASASCIIHNFSLLAWEQGLGLVWETYGIMYQEQFREAFGVKPGEKIVGVLHVGYPDKIPAAQPRIPAADRLTVIDS